MIKVLEHGNTYTKIYCSKCNCKFAYQKNDIREEYERIDAYDSKYIGKYIQCPECGNQMWLNNQSWGGISDEHGYMDDGYDD